MSYVCVSLSERMVLYLCVVCVIFVCVCVAREDGVFLCCLCHTCVLPERQCCNFVLAEKMLWYLCCYLGTLLCVYRYTLSFVLSDGTTAVYVCVR